MIQKHVDFSIVPDYKSPETDENSFKNVSGFDTTFSTFIVKISESEAAGSDLLFQKMTWHATFLNVKSILPESQCPGTLKFQEKSVASHAT